MTRRLFLLLAGLLATAPAGCGSKASAPPSVKGHVWYRGAPLPGGAIVFVPDEERGHGGDLLKAEITAEGTFELSGSPAAGWYRVAIAPLPGASTSLPTASAPYPGVPMKYRNPALSGLRAEVKAGENTFELELEDA